MIHFRVNVKSVNLGTDKLPVSEHGYLIPVSFFPVIPLSFSQGLFPHNVSVQDRDSEIIKGI